MSIPPTIGVSACRSLADYLESVRRVGGEPRVLDPATHDPADLVRSIDGLLLTGGADVDPALYGEERHPSVQDLAPERDRFEIDLVRRAVAARIPVLALCRGIQVMNIAFGGTLVQDISSQMAAPLDHDVEEPRFAIAHEIWVTKGSRLWAVMREQLDQDDSCLVNSRHHQAVRRVAEGFEISATAPDGVIEAIEKPDLPFCLGLQWHPENFWRTGEFRSLFEAFIAASGQREAT